MIGMTTFLHSRSAVRQPRSAALGLAQRTSLRWAGWAIFAAAAMLNTLAVPELRADQASRRTALVRALERARPSVVNIHSEKTLNSTDQRYGHIETSRRVNGMGTGVVIDERGFIITNQHVIEGVEKIRVTLHDGSVYKARLVAADIDTDLAVIKIECPSVLPTIASGTSADLMIGESVAAVGNAYGYEHTVTRGIISALHRTVQLSEEQQYLDLIQTDASINPGNSGGPLLNIDGEMIGINVAVRAGAQGIGFAIPVDRALEVAARLVSASEIAEIEHGIVPAKHEEKGPLRGLVVAKTQPGSAADAAGLQPGDVVLSAGDFPVKRALDLERALWEAKPGESVPLRIKRNEEILTVALSIQEIGRVGRSKAAQQAWHQLGLALREASSDDLRKYNTRYRGGLLVVDVREDGPAHLEGIRVGDVLVGLHIWETISIDDVAYVLGQRDLRQVLPLKFYILRKGRTFFGHLSVRGS